MENKEYLTIKEYAEIRGVSLASVYKRLNSTLKDYLVTVEGKKMLKTQVIQDEGLKRKVQPIKKSSTHNSTPQESLLEKQLEAKDKQIELLNEQIKELQEGNRKKDEFIQEQSRKLTELLEQSNILLQNNQLLLAQQNEAEEKIEEEIVEVESAVSASTESTDREQPQKKSWFRKLFE